MPLRDDHLQQAARNEAFVEFIRSHDTDRDHLDWTLTVTFYAAVHYVEAVFAEESPDVHCEDHGQRNDRLKRIRRYKYINDFYYPLYNASLLARYLDPSGKTIKQYYGIEVVHQFITTNLGEIRKSALKLLDL